MAGSARRPPHTPEPFEAVARADGLGVRICLQGELDLVGRSKLALAVKGVESFTGVRVVLDLSGLALNDAGGIRAIGRACDRLRGHGLDVTVLPPDGRRGLDVCWPTLGRGPATERQTGEASTSPRRPTATLPRPGSLTAQRARA